jgi:O-antigen/teichoic acid export membrane protein
MQGLEKLLFPAIVIVMGFPIKYGLNLLLVPQFETMGAAVSTIITLALLCLVMSIKLRKIIARPLFTVKFIRSVMIAVIAMILFLKGYLTVTSVFHGLFVSARIAETLQAVSAALFGGLLFLGIVIRSNVFSEEDLSLFPFGSKLAVFLKHSDRSRKYGEKN